MKLDRCIATFKNAGSVNRKEISINLKMVESWQEGPDGILMIQTTHNTYHVVCDKDTFDDNYRIWANTYDKI